jgi:tetratricopeptide (TPR) repeat protein
MNSTSENANINENASANDASIGANAGTNAYGLFIEGKKLIKDKDFLKAIMLLEKAKKLEPQKGSIREALATAYYNCGFYESAKKNFLKAIEIDATNDFAYYGLALCYIKEGKINIALGHLKIARVMKPEHKIYRDAVKKYSIILNKLK